MTRRKPKPRVIFDPMVDDDAWELGAAVICIENKMHPSELGITDSDQYDLVVEYYRMLQAPHTMPAPHRSASINQIKNRTGGRNRKERRGS